MNSKHFLFIYFSSFFQVKFKYITRGKGRIYEQSSDLVSFLDLVLIPILTGRRKGSIKSAGSV